ncbi:hypothetical protein D187_002702 [Cystobacter fuscus DSM 2262]|uniref:DUF676 domain-containing protein n=1 Tax=Cystobacter fuscus (strain ATCC 25194 / DSM 2262 / NBRC 100088 / M29) TaxID=1242864 RepID=S9QTH0_CYSF2|nr:hypothetical protein [Cystobacter fuscus]EPX59958.1 hypothetical protein D187_002702 [Cystobacter fuscus DSM 2262]
MTSIDRNLASPALRTTPSSAPAEKKPVLPGAGPVPPPTTGGRADGFEATGAARGAAANKLLGGIFGGGDKKYDGVLVGAKGATFPPGTPLSQVPGVTPRNNAHPAETLIYVNGINNNKDTQFASMQQLADRTGAKVIGVHNATEGMVSDLAQCVKDKLDKGKNPAVDTMADTVYAELKAGRGVHLVAHSQGALVTSRALNDVANRLRIEDGMSSAQVEKAMSKLKVETFGGAAAHFPDGPQYVHYVNKNDIVPTWFGQGDGDGVDEWARDGGKGAVVRRFEQGSGIEGTHSFDSVYLKHRVPFEQARAGR